MPKWDRNVTITLFAKTLIRKSERALKSAGLALRNGDCDTAVNRSYCAMFDIVRAALLRTGIAEDDMPRTQSIDVRSSWLEEERRPARENWLRLRQHMN